MKEVPCRRENLHSIISKISGSVELVGASPSEKGCTVDNKNITHENDHKDDEQLSPTYEFTDTTTANPAASSIPNTSQDSTVNSESGYGKIVDVLSLATATRCFKEPGSIWCSLCKCSVDKGHCCKINQPSFHGEQDEDGFTCELCGRYYNEKRKLRSHLRNRHKGFRLQEDEGYMCWQCWQAFPEIKILEQHIITVHGQEGRRQNTTWRPLSTTNTLPSPSETIGNQPTEVTAQNIASSFGKNQDMSLKRPGDDITKEYPAKRIPEGIVCNKVVNIGEVNGKVVVNDSFLLTTNGPVCPQPKYPNFSRLGSVPPERAIGITKVTMATSDGDVSEVVKEKTRRCEEIDTDEIEIVFVSEKKPDSDWSKQQGTMSNQPRSNSPIIVSKEFSNVSGTPVQTITKKPADSSGNVGDGPKFNNVTTDNVDSTTGQEEPKCEDVPLQGRARKVEQMPCDYQQLSEQACIFCFSNFSEKETLVTHLKTAHGWLDTFTCPICYYNGQHYLNVVKHFCQSHFHPIDDTLAQSEVKCLKCNIIFQDIAHLKKHSTVLHSFQIPQVPRYNTFKCKNCNTDFEKKFDAQKHRDAYHHFRIRYKCESCKMGFTAKYDFQEHAMYNHPELVKCFCQICGLGFKGNADLEEHIFEMHRRKAQFFCDKCRSEFGKKY